MKFSKVLIIALIVAALTLAACSAARPSPTSEPTAESDDAMDMDSSQSSQDFAPLVGGFYEGGDVLFIHTEASDAGVADMLTEMMAGPLVVLVPELADAPPELLSNVYVFTNGLEGMGPFGFQPDIFDTVPGDAAYRPLRAVNLVEWSADATPRELNSMAQLNAAEAEGVVTITKPGIVVNMPILVWPGGTR